MEHVAVSNTCTGAYMYSYIQNRASYIYIFNGLISGLLLQVRGKKNSLLLYLEIKCRGKKRKKPSFSLLFICIKDSMVGTYGVQPNCWQKHNVNLSLKLQEAQEEEKNFSVNGQ